MSETARVVLTAAVLSGAGLGVLAWRVGQLDASGPDRLIGELRLAQLAAIVLAGLGAIPIGLAIGAAAGATVHLDAALGVAFMTLAGYILLRDPREALWLAAVGFIVHALFNLAHRPGLLPPSLAPSWYTVGSSIFDVYLAALCYWGRRR